MERLEIVRRRMRAQRLTGEPFATPLEAVRSSGAVQAQEHAEAKWSVVERVAGADDAAVQAALDRGEILRTHVLRPTWHFVAADDLHWIARLTAPRVHQINGYANRTNALDPDTLARTDAALVSILGDFEPRTRTELRAELSALGIETPGQRLAHAVMHAELRVLICSGPRRGRQHTYVLADGRVPAAPERSREDDLAQLTRRYFSSHGPATPRDLVWWSSLTVTDVKAGLASCAEELEEVEPGLWAARDTPSPPLRAGDVHLIPQYDELGLAHRDLRSERLADAAGNGRLERPVLLDGETVGSWQRTLTPRAVTVRARLFVELDDAGTHGLRRAVERFGLALGLPSSLELES